MGARKTATPGVFFKIFFTSNKELVFIDLHRQTWLVGLFI